MEAERAELSSGFKNYLKLPKTSFILKMEILIVEVDLEGTAGLHWNVHGYIHGVSVKLESQYRIF